MEEVKTVEESLGSEYRRLSRREIVEELISHQGDKCQEKSMGLN